jgi:hypothetical protein
MLIPPTFTRIHNRPFRVHPRDPEEAIQKKSFRSAQLNS